MDKASIQVINYSYRVSSAEYEFKVKMPKNNTWEQSAINEIQYQKKKNPILESTTSKLEIIEELHTKLNVCYY